LALGRGSRVGSIALLVQSAFIADADRVVVVAHYMGTGVLLLATLTDQAIPVDVPVVAQKKSCANR